MREVVIVSAARTPIGSFGGSLKNVPASTLGATAVKAALERAGITGDMVDEVLMGSVLQGGLGQNIARQISIEAGIPIEVPSMSINKVCGSGLRVIGMAASMIKAGDADIIVAGGAESMSGSGYVAPKMRWGARMGDTQMIDMMVHDGLTDAFNHYHMGITAENICEQWNLTREELMHLQHLLRIKQKQHWLPVSSRTKSFLLRFRRERVIPSSLIQTSIPRLVQP